MLQPHVGFHFSIVQMGSFCSDRTVYSIKHNLFGVAQPLPPSQVILKLPCWLVCSGQHHRRLGLRFCDRPEIILAFPKVFDGRISVTSFKNQNAQDWWRFKKLKSVAICCNQNSANCHICHSKIAARESRSISWEPHIWTPTAPGGSPAAASLLPVALKYLKIPLHIGQEWSRLGAWNAWTNVFANFQFDVFTK